jgi:hypothetical protein
MAVVERPLAICLASRFASPRYSNRVPADRFHSQELFFQELSCRFPHSDFVTQQDSAINAPIMKDGLLSVLV